MPVPMLPAPNSLLLFDRSVLSVMFWLVPLRVMVDIRSLWFWSVMILSKIFLFRLIVPVPVKCCGSKDEIKLVFSVPLLSVMCPFSPMDVFVALTVAPLLILSVPWASLRPIYSVLFVVRLDPWLCILMVLLELI